MVKLHYTYSKPEMSGPGGSISRKDIRTAHYLVFLSIYLSTQIE